MTRRMPDGHKIGDPISGVVISVRTYIDELRAQTFYVNIRCDQCHWEHNLQCSRNEYKEALKAMLENRKFNSGYITEDESFYRNYRGDIYEGGYDE